MVRDAIVVGAGIIGATVSALLRARGLNVLTLDAGLPAAGTPPSGGHLRPEWFGGMKKEEYKPAMELLDEAWGLIHGRYIQYPAQHLINVYRVDIDRVVAWEGKTPGMVTKIDMLHNLPRVEYRAGDDEPGGTTVERCRLLLVAAGTGCGTLLGPKLRTVGKAGVSFRLSGIMANCDGIVSPWAPYKQITAHQQGPDELWCGDGSAILEGNWTAKREAECLARCRGALGNLDEIRRIYGVRPYAEKPDGEPCLFVKLGPKAYAATGAAKLGTIAAGWVARRILADVGF